MPDTEDDRYRAPALSKGLDILELLAASDNGLSQIDIGKRLGRTTSEIFRMLMVLRQRNYVEVGDDENYRLTTKLFEIASRHPIIQRLTAVSGEAMQKLANRINQCVHLCILQSGRGIIIAQVDGPDVSLVTVRLGAMLQINDSPSCRVIAAYMNDEELANLLALSDDDRGESREAFLADLPKIRNLGYCQGSSLILQGVTNLSAPIFDYRGRAVAAMTTPFIHRLGGRETVTVDEARDYLIDTCNHLSRLMGALARPDVRFHSISKKDE